MLLFTNTYNMKLGSLPPSLEITRRVQSDRSFRRDGRLQHLLDGCKNRLKLRVVFAFHYFVSPPHLRVCRQHAATMHERAHDRDIHLRSAVTPKALESMGSPS